MTALVPLKTVVLEELLQSRNREGFCEVFLKGNGFSIDAESPTLLGILLDGGLFWVLRCGLSNQAFCTFLCDLVGSFLKEAFLPEKTLYEAFTLAATMAQCLRLPKFHFLVAPFAALGERNFSWMTIDYLERECANDLERARYLVKLFRLADCGSCHTVRDIFKYYANDFEFPKLPDEPPDSAPPGSAPPPSEGTQDGKTDEQTTTQEQQQQPAVPSQVSSTSDEQGQGTQEGEEEKARGKQPMTTTTIAGTVDELKAGDPSVTGQEQAPPVVVHTVQSHEKNDANDVDGDDQMPVMRQRTMSFKMAERIVYERKSPPMVYTRSPAARELSDIIDMAITVAAPDSMILGLLLNCEMKNRLEILQDILTEIWFNTDYASAVLPCQWMPRDRVNTVLKESVRFFAAVALNCPQTSDFRRVCAEVCCSLMTPILIGELFGPHMALLVPELLQRIAKEPRMPFVDRCSIVCRVLSRVMDSTPFLLLWLPTATAAHAQPSPQEVAVFKAKLDAYFLWFGPDQGYEIIYNKKMVTPRKKDGGGGGGGGGGSGGEVVGLPVVFEQMFDEKLLAYWREVREGLHGVILADVADVVDSYLRNLMFSKE